MKIVRYAAAGAVVTDGDKVLVLLRPSRNEVRLPKGHIEEGEEAEFAGLRETVEETGYADLEALADLGEQIVDFKLAARANFGMAARVIRTERFFLAKLRSHEQIQRPFYDASQFVPVWRSWDEAEAELTYVAEREWLRRARAAADR